MPTGKALLVGVNHVNPAGYGGKWDGRLACPENDADRVKEILETKGFTCESLYSEAATAGAVITAIRNTAADLTSGDFFVFYYSGHGNRVQDQSGDEADRGDETLCLYDRQLLDDELFALWPGFQHGVRVLVIADSCHSGSATRNATNPDRAVKAMDARTNHRIMRKDSEHYDRLRENLPEQPGEIQATIGLISGCQDHQQSFENRKEGLSEMTIALTRCIETQEFGDYHALHEAILAIVPPDQTPQLSFLPVEDPPMAHEPPLKL